MDKTESEIRRGEQAERLLQDDVLLEAFESIEREFTEQWKTSPVRDQDAREKLWLMVKSVQRLRQELESFVMNGTAAKDTLARRVGQKLSQFL